VVLPNDEQLLAGCSIVASGHIAQPAIADFRRVGPASISLRAAGASDHYGERPIGCIE
jgi:hypothetical protein